MLSKKAQVSLYFTFLISAIVIIVITAVVAPLGVQMNTRMYLAGEQLLNDTKVIINRIDDATVRAAITDSIDDALATTQTTIEVNSFMFERAWVIMLALTSIIVFLFTRRVIEFSTGGIV